MPNRIIKESICSSENIKNLSPEAEILFYRLIVNCDDFGRMDGRTDMIRAKCYPLKSDEIKKHIPTWLQELSTNDLITIYSVNNQEYLYLNSWDKHQQKRAQKSKYPSPNGSSNLQSNDINGMQPLSNVYENENENRERESRNENDNIAAIFKIFEDNFQKITQVTTDQINDLINEYTPEKVYHALKTAIIANKRNLRYVEGILKNGTNKRNVKKLPTEYKYYTNV